MEEKLSYLVLANGGGYFKIKDGKESISATPYPINGFPKIDINPSFVEADYIKPFLFTGDLAAFFLDLPNILPMSGKRYHILYEQLCFTFDMNLCKWAANAIDKTFTIIPLRVLDPWLHPKDFILGIPAP